MVKSQDLEDKIFEGGSIVLYKNNIKCKVVSYVELNEFNNKPSYIVEFNIPFQRDKFLMVPKDEVILIMEVVK